MIILQFQFLNLIELRDGSLTLRLSDLADQDGNINIRETELI